MRPDSVAPCHRHICDHLAFERHRASEKEPDLRIPVARWLHRRRHTGARPEDACNNGEVDRPESLDRNDEIDLLADLRGSAGTARLQSIGGKRTPELALP